MKNLTLKNIAAACGGTYVGPEAKLEYEVSSITTDSRHVAPGALFAAIVGARTDGHLYIPGALASGAACALAEHLPQDCSGPVILVTSVLDALQQIAAFYRAQFDIPIVGVTGSVGKTTAKEMIAAVLSQKFCVHKTAGNFNNELGVPLTLFGLRPEHSAAVIEMGISHFGEMERLTAIVRPTAAVFTVIGHSHLEFLHNREGVFRAKSAILGGMPANGVVLANGDDDLLCGMRCRQTLQLFGLGAHCGLRAENIVSHGDTTSCELVSREMRIPVTIPAYGAHMVYAALAGAAAGLALGLGAEEIRRGIASYVPVGSRAHVIETGTLKIIDDCYNANPTSMASAIDSLSALPGRRVCILGDMFELGENSAALHRETGERAKARGIELVLTAGEMAREIAQGASGISTHFPDTASLISALPGLLQTGDTVLVKASHSMHFEKICRALETF